MTRLILTCITCFTCGLRPPLVWVRITEFDPDVSLQTGLLHSPRGADMETEDKGGQRGHGRRRDQNVRVLLLSPGRGPAASQV